MIPRQREPTALAAWTPETASSITRQAEGSRPRRRAASTKISGAGFTHYTQPAELGLQARVGAYPRVSLRAQPVQASLPSLERNAWGLRRLADESGWSISVKFLAEAVVPWGEYRVGSFC